MLKIDFQKARRFTKSEISKMQELSQCESEKTWLFIFCVYLSTQWRLKAYLVWVRWNVSRVKAIMSWSKQGILTQSPDPSRI